MKKSLISVLSLAIVCTACSSAWVSTLDSILGAAAPALINILQIVAVANSQPLNSGLVAKINADSTLIKTLAHDFSSASSESAPGVCQQLQTAVSTYQADQQLVLQLAQVSNSNIQTKISLLSNLVAGTVQAITAVIPSCKYAAVSPGSLRAAPPYDASTFTTRYNEILVAPTGDAVVDAETAKLKLHRHSKFARSVTFGILQ